MLAFPGNEAFARRLLDYLGRKGEDRFVVITQGFEETGSPRPGVMVRTPPDDPISQILGDANDLLNEFNEYVIEVLWILPLATLLAGVLLALAVWILPMNRPTYDARWTRRVGAFIQEAPPSPCSRAAWESSSSSGGRSTSMAARRRSRRAARRFTRRVASPATSSSEGGGRATSSRVFPAVGSPTKRPSAAMVWTWGWRLRIHFAVTIRI
jgi:hypothetical protein